MWNRLIMFTGVCVGLAGIGLSQQSVSGVSGPDAISARQASLDMSAITFRSMRDAVNGGREAKTQAYAAAALAKWAKALPRLFPAGTAVGETIVNTQALPAIWRDRAGFEEAAAYYAETTAKLATLAASNDTAGFTKQLDEVNQACASCHARYKGGDQGPPKK